MERNLKSSLLRERGTVLAKTVFIVFFVIFALYALSLIASFLWAIVCSLKTPAELGDDLDFGMPFALPSEFLLADKPILALFSNYKNVLSIVKDALKISFFTLIFNSIWFSIGTAIIPLFFTALTSYAFAKYDFIGKKPLYVLVILMMMIPILGSLPAAYKLYHDINIVNSPLILIVYTSGFGGNFLILTASFSGVSWSYAESAEIDGANRYTIFFKIMLPQILPALFTLFILGFIGGWNDYYTPYLYLKSMPTLATGLYIFRFATTKKYVVPTLFAGLIMMSIPIVIVFILFSDKIMSKVSIGGLKG